MEDATAFAVHRTGLSSDVYKEKKNRSSERNFINQSPGTHPVYVPELFTPPASWENFRKPGKLDQKLSGIG